MKVLILKNKLTLAVTHQVDKSSNYFKERAPRLLLDIKYKDIDEPFGIIFSQIGTDGLKRYGTDFRDRVSKYTSEYDIVVFMYQIEQNYQDGYVVARRQNSVNGCQYLEIPVNQMFIDIDWLWKTISHEMMHMIRGLLADKGVNLVDEMDLTLQGQPYFHNSDPYDIDGNYSIMFKKFEPYWNLLKPMDTYVYFKPSEIVGLKPELVHLLDQARGFAKVPFIITSGFRTVSQNQAVGGKPESAHLTGEAVDLLVKDSSSRYKLISALLEVGFNRIEDCEKHIHVDISKTLPQNVFVWSKDV